MTTPRDWSVKLVLDDGSDDDFVSVQADTIEDAARKVWEQWHPTAWAEASITGSDDWGWVNLDADFDFRRETS